MTKGGSEITRDYVCGIEKVAEFKEADIPKGFCPIEFKFSTSSSHDSHQWSAFNNAAIKRNRIYDVNTHEMVESGQHNIHTGFWRPHDDDANSSIVIELDGNVPISHISVMRAPPPTHRYPGHWSRMNNDQSERVTIWGEDSVLPRGSLIVEGGYSHTQNYSHGHRMMAYSSFRHGMWVTMFDLYAKFDKGAWINIGRYKGNHDEYTERLIYVAGDLGGNAFKYLKIVPIDWHNNIAMKVDVFADEKHAKEVEIIDKTNVTYTIEVPENKLTKKKGGAYLPDGGAYNDGWQRHMRDIEINRERREMRNYLQREREDYNNDGEAYMRAYELTRKSPHDLKFGIGDCSIESTVDRLEREKRRRNRSRRTAYRRRRRVEAIERSKINESTCSSNTAS